MCSGTFVLFRLRLIKYQIRAKSELVFYGTDNQMYMLSIKRRFLSGKCRTRVNLCRIIPRAFHCPCVLRKTFLRAVRRSRRYFSGQGIYFLLRELY